ncbi:MAG: hypothetical protein AB2A00_41110 [Myxococcota bacterium]
MGLRRLALVLAVVSLGCDPSSSRPCGKEMRRVRERESLRIHGLSQNEALPETVLRFQSAMKCAGADDVAELRVHAFLLQSRLEAQGNVEELDELERLLKEMGLEVDPDEGVRRGGEAAQQRLVRHATALRSTAGLDSDAALRGHLASLALDPEYSAAFPTGTRVLVNHSNTVESCFTVVNHQDLPVGTAMVSLKRGDKPFPLHGDPTTFAISRGKPKVARLCVNGALQTGDVVQLTVGGESAFHQTLTVTKDDEVRGALRRNFADVDLATLCQGATEHSARVACAIAEARRTP